METTLKMLPQRPENILQLAHHIVAQHLKSGADSPLKVHHVAEINSKANAAQRKHEEAMKFLKFAQELFTERDQLLGVAQPDYVPQNILYHIQSVQDALLEANEGREENLTQWGFFGE